MADNEWIHPAAIVEPGARIGSRSHIWAFTHVLPGAVIGEDCNICDHVFIENEVTVGDRVTVKCGVQLWDGIRLEDDVFVGPNATFTNDPFPRSKRHLEHYPQTIVQKGASIGANATILPGLKIGQNAMIGAGAVVTRDVPAHAIVVGNPARITGYIDTFNFNDLAQPGTVQAPCESKIPGVKFCKMQAAEDMRGKISVGEYDQQLPFVPKRYFVVFDVPSKEVRGQHAHRSCHQFLVCVQGSVSVVAENGKQREEFTLSKVDEGLYIPPMIWTTQYKYSPDAILLVLASHVYDANDYIRDYDQYLQELEPGG